MMSNQNDFVIIASPSQMNTPTNSHSISLSSAPAILPYDAKLHEVYLQKKTIFKYNIGWCRVVLNADNY